MKSQPPNLTPIQILLLRDRSNPESEGYFNTLRLAFEGSDGKTDVPQTYLSDAIDLQIQVLDPAGFGMPGFDPEPLVRAARHTVAVVLEPWPKGSLHAEQMGQVERRIGTDHLVGERIPEPVADETYQRSSIQPGQVEKSLHPVATALRAMERARRLLQRELNGEAAEKAKLKFFISHAKIDGMPLALSLVSLMRRFAGALAEGEEPAFETFYDAEDIHAGDRWREVLQQNAGHSVLIVLYTEEYENRYWCRQEYLWAEQNRVPILLVELRTGLYHEGARLPLGPAPTVRIHDGNLIRVLFQAIAIHLRSLRNESRIRFGDYAAVPRTLLPRHPSMVSLHAALEEVRQQIPEEGGCGEIIYPNPRLNQAELDALQPLLESGGRPIRLITPDEL